MTTFYVATLARYVLVEATNENEARIQAPALAALHAKTPELSAPALCIINQWVCRNSDGIRQAPRLGLEPNCGSGRPPAPRPPNRLIKPRMRIRSRPSHIPIARTAFRRFRFLYGAAVSGLPLQE